MKFYITTLGCPKNESDSYDMEKSLLYEGFEKASSLKEADFHIINTCAFIEEAKKETIDTIFSAIHYREKLKKKDREQKVIVVGCFSERYREEIREEIPEIDFFIGTHKYHRVGKILKSQFSLLLEPKDNYSFLVSQDDRRRKFYGYVKIADGCNRNCSFCAIPLFKGKFFSLDTEEILGKVKELTESGVKEICLVSQDTGTYGRTYEDLIILLERIQEIEKVEWIRLLYLYPDQKTMKILKAIKERSITKFVPYLDSPVQHVSGKILKKMNRYGSYEFYTELFSLARELFPDLEIRTSFLIGFPEESHDDVELIKKFIEENRIEHVSFFAYSPEENTPSYTYARYINRKEIKEKVNELQRFYEEKLKEIMAGNVGKNYRCLLERIKKDEMYFRRPQAAPEIDDLVAVPFDYRTWKARYGSLPVTGNFYDVEITGFAGYDYIGSLQLPVQVAK